MLSVSQVRLALRPGDWLVSLDLESAYWHVPVHPRFGRFLAVQVGARVLQFSVMPFGLYIAPWVFPKLPRGVAAGLTRAGVASLMFLDNWLLHAASRERVLLGLSSTLEICGRMGFRFTIAKSRLSPTQSLD